MMMNPHLLPQPSLPDFACMDFPAGGFLICASSDICSNPCFSSKSEDLIFSPSVGEFLFNMDDLGIPSNSCRVPGDELGDVSEWVESLSAEGQYFSDSKMDDKISAAERSSMSPSMESSITSINQSPCLSPAEAENRAPIFHLLKEYGFAMETGCFQLGEVISRRLREMGSPCGAALDRLAFYSFRGADKQSLHLRQESNKNYKAAFRAFYEISLYGRFAHFAANATILAAVPAEVETIHVVDFDLQAGVQWPPLLEAAARRRRVRITSIRDQNQTQRWKFEETKGRLQEFARSRGLRVAVDEMEMEELVAEKRRMKKRGGEKEWVVFNCMVGLPHMERNKQRSHGLDFLRAAKELLSQYRGIVVYGSGEDGDEISFVPHFDGRLQRCSAMFESMEWHFPSELADARTAMECLFLGPLVSSLACFSRWQESSKESHGGLLLINFEGCRLNREVVEEAMEMVMTQGGGLYGVKVEGETENELVLQWKGSPLVKVSAWR